MYIYGIVLNMATPVEAPAFDVGDYLDRRAETTNFVVVELGHGAYPLVANQPRFFTGGHTYIGIEACMRSGKAKGERRRADFQEHYDDVNATFLTHELGAVAVSSDEEYEGEYKVETILGDGAGDEVVASNVFGDPYIAQDFNRTDQLLGEMSRLASSGMIILRETTTPWKVVYVNDIAKHLGLKILAKVTPADALEWEQLELFYGTHKEWSRSNNPYPESHYLFLANTAQNATADLASVSQ